MYCVRIAKYLPRMKVALALFDRCIPWPNIGIDNDTKYVGVDVDNNPMIQRVTGECMMI